MNVYLYVIYTYEIDNKDEEAWKVLRGPLVFFGGWGAAQTLLAEAYREFPSINATDLHISVVEMSDIKAWVKSD